MKVLILGASGMVGHCLFILMKEKGIETYGTIRDEKKLPENFFKKYQNFLYTFNVNYNKDWSFLNDIVKKIQPDIIINTIGIIKHKKNILPSIYIIVNSIFPFFLKESFYNTRIIHISTDCVFDGLKGNYTENDPPNPIDIYGKSKQLGEIDGFNCVTLRTSIIGHELKEKYNLLEWFLSQPDNSVIKGYSNAIFSGFTVVELEKIISNIIIPNKNIYNLYHLSSNPINKYDLLLMIKEIYKKNIKIEKDSTLKIDRSLNSEKFKSITNYIPPSWEDMIKDLYNYYIKYNDIYK
jgi:dTDP-4-dehydrorhamnose reductase